MDLEKINSREFAKRVIDYRTDKLIQGELQKIHYIMFGKYFQANCGNCIKQAYVTIREKINNNMIFINPNPKQMNLFEIKKSASGVSKQIHINHEVITNDNLTDEKALEILKVSPGHIEIFAKFPENWKELIEGSIVPEESIDQFQQDIVKVKKGKK